MAESEEELKSLLMRVNEENEKADLELTFIHWHESATGVHVFSILNPPSHLPPHPIPLGHPSAPAPNTLRSGEWPTDGKILIRMVRRAYPHKW